MDNRAHFILKDTFDGKFITVPENYDGMEILYSESDKTDRREDAYVFATFSTGYSDFIEEEFNEDSRTALNPNLFNGEPELSNRFKVIWLIGYPESEIFK